MTISNTSYAAVGQAQRLHAARPLETVSRVVGAAAPQTLSAAALARDVKTGVVSSIPFDALFSSQEYRRGEITAQQYVAKTLNFSISAASWTVGGAMMGALLAPVGLPAFAVGVAGFAAGMVANEVWLRTAGKPITEAIEKIVPAGLAETVAEVFTKAIANPLYDTVWKPLTQAISPIFSWAMKNKVTAGAALGGLALAFPNAARAIAPEIATMAAGTAAGIAFTGKVIDPILPPADEMAAPKPPKAKGAGQAAGLHFARIR